MVQTLNLAVLLSGSGRTLENFQQLIDQGRLNARIAIVVSSKGDAYGLVRAQQHSIDAIAIPRKLYGALQAFNDAINDVLARYDIDLVVLAGFLSLYRPAAHLVGRVMNIHLGRSGPGFSRSRTSYNGSDGVLVPCQETNVGPSSQKKT